MCLVMYICVLNGELAAFVWLISTGTPPEASLIPVQMPAGLC